MVLLFYQSRMAGSHVCENQLYLLNEIRYQETENHLEMVCFKINLAFHWDVSGEIFHWEQNLHNFEYVITLAIAYCRPVHCFIAYNYNKDSWTFLHRDAHISLRFFVGTFINECNNMAEIKAKVWSQGSFPQFRAGVSRDRNRTLDTSWSKCGNISYCKPSVEFL